MSAPAAAPTPCKVMLSKHVATHLLAEVEEGLKTLEEAASPGRFPANDDPAALVYAQMTKKTCEEK